jgi:two-component system nitrogen regulation response regulator GlnG
MASLLLIDDDTLLVPEQVRYTFPAPGHGVVVAATGHAGIDAMRAVRPDVVLLDILLPDQSGLDVYQAIRTIDARVPVIFITTTNTADTAIEAMKLGAYDYLQKPLDIDRLRRIVHGALKVTRFHAPVALADPGSEDHPEGAMLGSSPSMLEIYKAIGRVAPQNVPVLVTGESGTGKELVARAIYQHSTRAKGPFLALNCAAIPENLLESELFGHERGSFTGADRRRIGKFEQCNGGTILLDEIGELPLALQAKLLRLLQEQRFERVGGNETIQTDVRIIASTNRDLRARSMEDKFRADLYYRLGVFTIHLPPLRDRREDLPDLVNYFVRQFARQMGRDVRDVAPEALSKLLAYSWPGNVRELQSVVRQALLNASGSVLHPMFLPELAGTPAEHGAGRFDLERFIRERLDSSGGELHADTHREVDRLLMTLALEHTRGNQRDAAKLLGISRQTMRMKLRGLGLFVTQSVGSEDEND